MIKKIAILGSTGSIGSSTLSILKKQKNFKVKLLTANRNITKIYKQACQFKVKDVIIEDKYKYLKFKNKFKKKKINLHLGISNLKKISNFNVDYSMNAISGLNGLEPTLDIIPKSKNMLIANKESIICGWNLIFNKLKKYNTKFIPIDSEHFSIWKLIENEKHANIEKIILTASGGPFLNLPKKKYFYAKPSLALKHPNWKMGKKISIDSSTMMNKIFEFIEAKKIFKLRKKNISILIHPTSYVHAIVFFKGHLIKFLAHDTKMTVPIANALEIKKSFNDISIKSNINKINNLQFDHPKKNNFPLLSVLNLVPNNDSYFETILITINDILVDKYLKNQINYGSIHLYLLKFLKNKYFKKYYKLKPKSIYDIKKMKMITQKYLKQNFN